jgi:hypothetical protein
MSLMESIVFPMVGCQVYEALPMIGRGSLREEVKM